MLTVRQFDKNITNRIFYTSLKIKTSSKTKLTGTAATPFYTTSQVVSKFECESNYRVIKSRYDTEASSSFKRALYLFLL